MPDRPLPWLLSWAWVAHTIEVDNEVERATAAGGIAPRFRISLVMWANFLRFVPDDGIRVDELTPMTMAPASLVRSTLGGLERWGYVVMAGPAGGRRPGYGSARGVRGDTVVRPTRVGRYARAAWPAAIASVEARWVDRFGAAAIGRLGGALDTTLTAAGRAVPDAPPIVGPANGFVTDVRPSGSVPAPVGRPLVFGLGQALTAFAAEADAHGPVSMALGANFLRFGDSAVALRDLPRRTGLSKEAVAMGTGWLSRHGLATVEAGPGGARSKLLRLTVAGLARRDEHDHRVAAVEERWRTTCGGTVVGDLRDALGAVLDQRAALAAGLEPPPGTWRAQQPYRAQTDAVVADPIGALPRHPAVLHRGGWPDGA